ncbi:MAG: MBL fold metallo-hydrolase, partial [Zestosphaera sp.]
YHAGDTGLTYEMKLVGELYKPLVALLPIGGHFTMGPREAAYAANLIKPKYVIPMHYGTFPVLKGTPEEFRRYLIEFGVTTELVVLKPGEETIIKAETSRA